MRYIVCWRLWRVGSIARGAGYDVQRAAPHAGDCVRLNQLFEDVDVLDMTYCVLLCMLEAVEAVTLFSEALKVLVILEEL